MSDNYDVVHELARLLAEATRARRLAEAAAMAPQRAEAERSGDALETAQAQIAELRARLADTEAELCKSVQGMMSVAGIALLKRAQAKLKRERDEAHQRNERLCLELAEARAALAAAHEHDAAEVARLRGLLGEVVKAWQNCASIAELRVVMERAEHAVRGGS